MSHDHVHGDTVVVLVSLTCTTTVRFHPSRLIKVTLVTYEKSVVQFDSTKHHMFSPATTV